MPDIMSVLAERKRQPQFPDGKYSSRMSTNVGQQTTQYPSIIDALRSRLMRMVGNDEGASLNDYFNAQVVQNGLVYPTEEHMDIGRYVNDLADDYGRLSRGEWTGPRNPLDSYPSRVRLVLSNRGFGRP